MDTKLIFIISFIVIRSTLCFSQEINIDSLNVELEKLSKVQKILSDSLVEVDSRILQLKFKIDSLETESLLETSIYLVIEAESLIRNKAGYPAETIYTTKEGEKALIIDVYDDNYLNVKINGILGFTHRLNFINSSEIDNLVQVKKQKAQFFLEDLLKEIEILEKDRNWIKADGSIVHEIYNLESKVVKVLKRGDVVFISEVNNDWSQVLIRNFKNEDLTLFSPNLSLESKYIKGWVQSSLISEIQLMPYSYSDRRRINFVNEYGSKLTTQNKNDILDGQIRIGMTKEMIIASWGNPFDINRTVTRYGVREQLVYGSDISNRRYVYIDDGLMTSFQD